MLFAVAQFDCCDARKNTRLDIKHENFIETQQNIIRNELILGIFGLKLNTRQCWVIIIGLIIIK